MQVAAWIVARLLVSSLISAPVARAAGRAYDYPDAPNPGAIRDRTLDLNGSWRFAVGDDAGRAPRFDREITVPYPPESLASGLVGAQSESEVSRYERDVRVDDDWRGALLHFEGVDYACEVFVNDRPIGTHVGAFAPFALDISAALASAPRESGARRLRVRLTVRDSRTARAQVVGKQERRPNEGVIFYRNMSGIWKDVWLEEIGPSYVRDLWLSGDHHGRFALKADLARRDPGQPAVTRARFAMRFESDPTPVLDREIDVVGDKLEWYGTVPGARPWSTERPDLYFTELTLFDAAGRVLDRVRSYVAFVTFTSRGGYLVENDRPFQVRGHLNQHVYPDTLYTPTRARTRAEIGYFKAAGFNSERYHQNTPPRWALYLYARHGVRVSLEMPAARDLRGAADRALAARQWREINLKLGGAGCVGWRVGVNETWGMLDDPDHGAPAGQAEIESYLADMHRVTMDAQVETTPAGRCATKHLQPFNDGWESSTPIRGGVVDPALEPASYFLALHDYRTGGELRRHYGDLNSQGLGGAALPANGREALLPGFDWDPGVPVMLSEMGGNSFSAAPCPDFFTYHNYPTVHAWAEAVAQNILAAGAIPLFTAGYVVTQTMDAGHDPADPARGGEQNGLLAASGAGPEKLRPKMPAEYWRRVNARANASWRRNLCRRWLTQF